MFSKKKSAPTSTPLLPEFSRPSLFGTAKSPSVISLPPVAVLRAATTGADPASEHSETVAVPPQKSSPTGSSSQWTNEMRSKISAPFGFRQEVHVDKDLTWSSDADPRSLFTFEEKLGTGAFGSVWKAVLKSSGFVLAIKEIPVELESDRASIKKEIDALKQASHPNIVQYYGCIVVPAEQTVWILMDYCSGGSCSDLMSRLGRPLTELEASCVISDALRGLSYLHAKGVVHRDIKAANLLLTSSGVAKIADFGVSETLSSTVDQSRSKVAGSPYWMAPEILLGNTYSSAIDVWALGITAIELLTGRPPHYDQHPMRAMYKIPFVPPPRLPSQTDGGLWTPDAQLFVEQCLQAKPDKRPKAVELETLEWIRGARDVGLDSQAEMLGGRKRTTSSGGALDVVGNVDHGSGSLPPLSASGPARIALVQIIKEAEVARVSGKPRSRPSGFTGSGGQGSRKGDSAEVLGGARASPVNQFAEGTADTMVLNMGEISAGTVIIHEDDRPEAHASSRRLMREDASDAGGESEAESEGDSPFAAESDSEQVVIRSGRERNGGLSPLPIGRKPYRNGHVDGNNRRNSGSGSADSSPGPGTPIVRARSALPVGQPPVVGSRTPRRQPSTLDLLRQASGELERAAAAVTAGLTEFGEVVGPKLTELGEVMAPALSDLANTANARMVELGEVVAPKITEMKEFVEPRAKQLLDTSYAVGVQLSESAVLKFNQFLESLPPDVALFIRRILRYLHEIVSVLSQYVRLLLTRFNHYRRQLYDKIDPSLRDSRGFGAILLAREVVIARARVISQSKWFQEFYRVLVQSLIWAEGAASASGVVVVDGGKLLLRTTELTGHWARLQWEWTLEEAKIARTDPSAYANGLTRRVPRAAGDAVAATMRRTWRGLIATPFET
ncbi:kinase-like protein [Gonapodya prolifera JEL478]|uniref:non-specific serine/threonine protein kinase n=1 Tax=Gonapodya prolifera (strain JEL478) TaxID=1344416 RepID=A0A139ASX1_GONPJ|nr:kinase-like protein [Gonapodya prolifera JEL478]|eukprot:KXS19828.1 kinase-like protein [Gonapodya prolifera JEL478]